MIQLLNAGLSVDNLVELIAWRFEHSLIACNGQFSYRRHQSFARHTLNPIDLLEDRMGLLNDL